MAPLQTKIRTWSFASVILLIFAWPEFTRATPEFAVTSNYSCGLCHVNPTGGGLRNDYGSSIFAPDELIMAKGSKLSRDDWEGFVTEYLRVGGDVRVQAFSHSDSASRKTALFPMQADFYAEVLINSKISVFAELDLSGRLSQEFWTLLRFKGENWIRLGKGLPDFGLRLDDHTAFTRGGNIRRRHLTAATEGFPFSPYVSLPAFAEIGLALNDRLTVTGSVGNGFISGAEPSYGFNENWSDKFKSLGLDYYLPISRRLNAYIGLNTLAERGMKFYSFSQGAAYGKASWLSEISAAENWNSPSGKSLAVFQKFNYWLLTGLRFSGEYHFYDPDTDYSSGAVGRYTMGIDLFPVNIVEIKLQTRLTAVEGAHDTTLPEYLIQIHSWF